VATTDTTGKKECDGQEDKIFTKNCFSSRHNNGPMLCVSPVSTIASSSLLEEELPTAQSPQLAAAPDGQQQSAVEESGANSVNSAVAKEKTAAPTPTIVILASSHWSYAQASNLNAISPSATQPQATIATEVDGDIHAAAAATAAAAHSPPDAALSAAECQPLDPGGLNNSKTIGSVGSEWAVPSSISFGFFFNSGTHK
jgi:hypothetical protein